MRRLVLATLVAILVAALAPMGAAAQEVRGRDPDRGPLDADHRPAPGASTPAASAPALLLPLLRGHGVPSGAAAGARSAADPVRAPVCLRP